jgi:adenosylcobyric acid synthase
MGLLPFATVFSAEKTRTQVNGTLQAGGLMREISGTPFKGYEIHMGNTVYEPDAERFSVLQPVNGAESSGLKPDGCCSQNVAGTYVHGLFDKKEMQEALVRLLMKEKGLENVPMRFVDDRAFKETQYDLLADTLRAHMDMEAIYRILEEGMI